MQVIFIHHSCFLIEVDEMVLIFDWFAGDRLNGFQFHGVIPEYEPDTPIYMFASHKHQDHFDMDMLRWAEKYTDIHYILSKDCKMSPHFLQKHGISPDVREKILYVGINETYKVDDLQIETFRSTDAGVAFLVEVRGRVLFHAGDLNNWKWEGAGELTNGKMERDYKREIRKLAGRKIHLAFVPMDTRQKEYQTAGFDYFVRNTDTDYIFPMHMWQDYAGIERYKKTLSGADAERIIEISQENQVFEIQER